MSSTENALGSIGFEVFAAHNDQLIREELKQFLRDRRDQALDDGDRKAARACRRALDSARVFNRIAAKVEREAIPQFLEARAAGTVGADGSFLKWLLEWLSKEENWQGILKLILSLMSIFGGGGIVGLLLPFLLSLVFASGAFAQIKADPTYPVFTQIELDVETPEATYREVAWDFSPPKISGKALDDGRFLFTAPPGRYDVIASAIWGTKDGDKITLADGGHKLWKASFEIVGDCNGDGDDVKPDPIDPNPPIVVDGAAVLIFEESSERSVSAAKMIADAKFWSTVIDRGMIWRIYDIDSPDAKAYAEKIKAIGLPALVILKGDKVLSAGKLPATNAEVNQAIKKATGK